MVTRRPFTPDADAYIITNYATMLLKDIAAHLGYHWQNVQQHRDILARRGLLDKAQRAYQRTWTEDEVDYLNDFWGRYSDAAIAAHLGRTAVALTVKAKRLGLSRRQNVWTASNVAEIFGVDGKTICAWLARGWITGHKAPFGAGGQRGEYRSWSIDADSVEHFVRTMGYAYDWRRMAEGDYLTRMAKRIDKADPWLTLDQAAALLGMNRGTLNRWAVYEGLTHQRRPKYSHYGPWAGLIVVQRSTLVVYAQMKKEQAHWNRSASARERARRRGWRVKEAA